MCVLNQEAVSKSATLYFVFGKPHNELPTLQKRELPRKTGISSEALQ